jgi:hypothetical protein
MDVHCMDVLPWFRWFAAIYLPDVGRSRLVLGGMGVWGAGG